jgi:hypothetical protein
MHVAEARVAVEEICALLPDVLKRDILEGDEATQASKHVNKLIKKALRKRGSSSKKLPKGGGKSTQDLGDGSL